MKKRKNKPTLRNLQEDIGFAVSEIMHVKDHIRHELQPKIEAFMNLFEKYIIYKNDLDGFLKLMEEKDESKKIAYREPKTGKKKQAKRSRTAKTVGKNGKGIKS
jgi:hypothetical protein